MKTLLKHIRYYYYYINLEAIFWIIALAYLISINPYESSHYSLCLFNNLGLDFCPGCGIGKSIAYIFHADFTGSFESHPLGIFALVVIVSRIISLITGKKLTLFKNKEVYNG